MPRGERGASRPYLRGDIWWIRYKVPGEEKERRESSKSTDKKFAMWLLNKRQEEIAGIRRRKQMSRMFMPASFRKSIDADVLAWLGSHGDGCLTKMNAVLRQAMEQEKEQNAKG